MLVLTAAVVMFLGYYVLSSVRASEVDVSVNNIEKKNIKVIDENEVVEHKQKIADEKKSLALLVENINNLKQGTFESTKEFKKRHLTKMSEFQNSTKFYAQKGLEDYSAGISTMESYNPDTQIMTLSLNWNSELKKMLPELEKINTVYTYIARAEAKKLFEKKKKHFFHIELAYADKKLEVSKIAAYDKYAFYENLNDVKKVNTIKTLVKKPTVQNHVVNIEREKNEISKKKIVKKESNCSFYYCKTDGLNVRENASSNSRKISKIRHNERVCIVEKKKGWSLIKGRGWVWSEYLSKRKHKKPQIIKKASPYFWHCDAASDTTKVWAEHESKQSAINSALYKCDRINRSYQQCDIIRCY